ncbi:unnamed protein product [Lasius platythorax]|uniref:Uncharacterized protein n=1 Tax=Lasius platythorax TaxID=488582 RepID=A0AAV2PB51_9HYME
MSRFGCERRGLGSCLVKTTPQTWRSALGVHKSPITRPAGNSESRSSFGSKRTPRKALQGNCGSCGTEAALV